jgi:D-alanine-D-alanine ligase
MGEEVMERPYVLKPSAEGSSIGVHIVEKDSEFSFTDSVWNSGSPLVIEEFIPGRELTSVVFDEKALGVIELQPEKGFYDYESKYTHGKTIHITPAEIPPEIYAAVNEIALKAHEALGCRTLSRADFRYDDTNGHSVDNIYLLEINTHPGFTELSLVPELAAYNGIPFIAIVDKLVQDATCMSKKADNNAVPVYSYEKAEV